MTLAYITIQFSSHEYKATVINPSSLEDFLSKKDEPFKVIKTEVVEPKSAHLIAKMLNRISRFGHSQNRTATA